jgi:signal transduction histidine kinase
MSFARLRHAPKTIGFRLAVWSFSFFVVGSGVLFGLAYLLVSASLQQRDRDNIAMELRELAGFYRAGGRFGVEEELARQDRLDIAEGFWIRLAVGDTAHVIRGGARWSKFDLRPIDSPPTGADKQWFSLPSRRGHRVLEVAALRLSDGAILQVGQATNDREAVLHQFRSTVAGVLIPILLLGAASGTFIAFWSLRPIRQIIQTVQAIETGTVNARVPTRPTRDELDELGGLFNRMLDRNDALIVGMRGALDTVAHDLRTPVARIRGVAEMALRSDNGSEATRHALADCVEESDELLTMLNTLMDISEAETGALKLHLDRVNVSVLVEDTVDLYRHVADEKRIEVATKAAPELWLIADRSRLRQVLANLLDNAIKYTPPGGRVEVAAGREEQAILVSVKDTGMGLTPEEIPRIWDRLYRGDKSRSERGLGLGLSVVRAIVRAHGGQAQVSSVIGGGSTFAISLPVIRSHHALPS